MSLTIDHADPAGRVLTVEIDYAFNVPQSYRGPDAATLEIEQATVTEIDGRRIVGDPRGEYMTAEAAAESEWFEGLIKSDAKLRARIEDNINEHEWDRRYGDDYERGAE